MFGKIVYLASSVAHIEIQEGTPIHENLLNMHVVFEDNFKRIVGEVEDVDTKIIKVRFLGELTNNGFVGGVIRKPTLQANVRLITEEELQMLIGIDSRLSLHLGSLPLYNDYPMRIDINDMFSNHMAVFGNTGSGKSCGVARLLQNVFSNPEYLPYKASFFIFDAYGEYHSAFREINTINPNYNFKYYTTNKQDQEHLLRIPLWLLDRDDFVLLLQAETHSQITIIDEMLKLVRIFTSDTEESKKYCNHLIAKAIVAILFTNQTSASKRNDVFSILSNCTTPEFNLDVYVQGVGYTRKFRDLFVIDTAGNFPESNLMMEYVSSFIDDSLDQYRVDEYSEYRLEDLEKAMNFTLISEGLLKNDKMYNEATTLKVRLHELVVGENKEYFRFPNYISVRDYIGSLITTNGNMKAQIINFNLEEVDDTFAKTLTKIFTKMLFDFSKGLEYRASVPFHIFLEESHRYVQNDTDKYLLGYNIFERTAKEGRKYGVILNLISQRPVELSETVISQCANFLMFKLSHPRDLDYVTKMIPNIGPEVVEMQKSLQPGTCVAFGKAFKVPMIVKMDMPNPAPSSSNCNVFDTWRVE